VANEINRKLAWKATLDKKAM